MDFHQSSIITNPTKTKQCYWCGEECPEGQPRVRMTGTFEGDFFCDAYHTECHTARNQWWDMPANRGEHEGPPEHCMQRGAVIPRRE